MKNSPLNESSSDLTYIDFDNYIKDKKANVIKYIIVLFAIRLLLKLKIMSKLKSFKK